LSTISVGDPLQVRYDAASNQYQVKAGSEDWTALVDDPEDNTTPNMRFRFASRSNPGGSLFQLYAHHRTVVQSSQYRYSNLATWALPEPGETDWPSRSGVVALGVPTAAGAVPTTGTGTYQGQIQGISNFRATSIWGGEYPEAPIWGNVVLVFDFGQGSLSGQIQPFLGCDCVETVNFPILAFTDTVFGVGNTEFSGRFQTPLSGPNGFSGRFTGPSGQELIGRWAFPFTHAGSSYSADGGWIAKRNE
jgi:hypothetical protein